MENSIKTILVTGSNKGIGFGIVEALLKSSELYNIIITSRTKKNGLETLQQLKDRFPSKAERIWFKRFDLLTEGSIEDLVQFLSQEFKKIDILVNNAGIMIRGPMSKKVLDITMNTNYFKTIELTELILDKNLINNNGKIIFISSSLGRIERLKKCNLEIYSLMSKYQDNLNEDELQKIVDKYLNEVMDQKAKKFWPGSVYAVSKMFLSVYTFLISRRKDLLDRKLQIYSCCPGWCQTDLTKGSKAPNTIQQGAETPVFLINLPFSINMNFQGKFFKDKEIMQII